MKDIIFIVLMVILYGVMIFTFIKMHLTQKKQDKLFSEYLKEELEIAKLRKKQIKEEMK